MAGSDEHMRMVDDCLKRESMLSEWEATFIDSILNQLGEGRSLTRPQSEKLDDIWEKVTA